MDKRTVLIKKLQRGFIATDLLSKIRYYICEKNGAVLFLQLFTWELSGSDLESFLDFAIENQGSLGFNRYVTEKEKMAFGIMTCMEWGKLEKGAIE